MMCVVAIICIPRSVKEYWCAAVSGHHEEQGWRHKCFFEWSLRVDESDDSIAKNPALDHSLSAMRLICRGKMASIGDDNVGERRERAHIPG